MNSGIGFLIVISLFNVAAMVVFYVLLKSRFSTRKILAEIRSEVDKLVADLGREADRDVALLESRIKSLRALMDEADRRILLADKEDAKRKIADSVLSESSAARVSAAAQRQAAPRSVPPVSREPDLFSDSAASPEAPVIPSSRPLVDTVKVISRPTIKRSEKMIEPIVPAREKVLDLAMKGLSSDMIAHTLSMSLGEVELILNMNDSSL